MKRAQNFDEQNFDESFVGFIGKALTGKRLEGKTLTNRWPFVKIHQSFPPSNFCAIRYHDINHDNQYRREIFSIVMSAAKYYHQYCDYLDIYCS